MCMHCQAMPSFKANMVGRFTPFVQSSAQSLLLDEVHRDTADGDAVQFCPLAKRFAFEIGAKFVFGPLLNDEERKHAFTVCDDWWNVMTIFYVCLLFAISHVICLVCTWCNSSALPEICQRGQPRSYWQSIAGSGQSR